MADVFDVEKRSAVMALIKGRNTKPEILVRQMLHRLGFRFRLHRKDLPGTPDIVLPKYRTAIFVSGCFWHGHDCPRGKRPADNADFWNTKIDKNIQRDERTRKELEGLGWRVLVIWTCSLKKSKIDELATMLTDFLQNDPSD